MKKQIGFGLAALLLFAGAWAHAETSRSTSASRKRLVAYYLYQDQSKVPAYTANQIPFKKLIHLIHVALVTDPGNSVATFITYDNPESTERKVVYALAVRNLGGVFMWELSEDFDGKKQDLLNSMYRAYRAVDRLGH